MLHCFFLLTFIWYTLAHLFIFKSSEKIYFKGVYMSYHSFVGFFGIQFNILFYYTQWVKPIFLLLKWQIYLIQFLPNYHFVHVILSDPFTRWFICFALFVCMCVGGCAHVALLIVKDFNNYSMSWFCFTFKVYLFLNYNNIYTEKHTKYAQLSEFSQSGHTHSIIAEVRKLRILSIQIASHALFQLLPHFF